MKRTSKLITCLCLMLICFIIGSINMVSAKATNDNVTVENASFYMVAGASVRCESDVKTKNGLRFSTILAKEDYESLTSNSNYSNVEFGLLIMPEDYVDDIGPLNKATVFGVDGTRLYDFATLVDGQWVYDGDGSLTRIMNFSASELAESTLYEGFMRLNGTIVNLKDGTDTEDTTNNIDRKFISASYIKYDEGGNTKYRFAEEAYDLNTQSVVGQIGDNCTRSMAEVAFSVVNDTANNEEETIAFVKDNYLNKVDNDVTFGADYVTEYVVGSTVTLPTPTLGFLGEDTAKYCEWEVEKEGTPVAIENNQVTFDDLGEYTLKLNTKTVDTNTIATYKLNSVLCPAYATAGNSESVISYGTKINVGYNEAKPTLIGLNIAPNDTFKFNRVYDVDESKLFPKTGDSFPEKYRMFEIGFDNLTTEQYANKDLTLTIRDGMDSSKYLTITFAPDANGQVYSEVSYSGSSTKITKTFTYLTAGWTGTTGTSEAVVTVWAYSDGLYLRSYHWYDSKTEISNAKISGFEMFSSFTFELSSTTGIDIDVCKINDVNGTDDFTKPANTFAVKAKPFLAEYAVGTELELSAPTVTVSGTDVSEYFSWKFNNDPVTEGKVTLSTLGKQTISLVANGSVVKTYDFNVSENPKYAVASSANTTIAYDATSNLKESGGYKYNCFGLNIAAGDTVSINKVFKINQETVAKGSTYRLFSFTLDNWERAGYVGKELLITVTSANDSSKFFTILVKTGSSNIIVLGENGGIAQDASGCYDTKTYLSTDPGSEKAEENNACHILLVNGGLNFTPNASANNSFAVSNILEDFDEFVVTISSNTGYSVDFGQINREHIWTVDYVVPWA